jgi:hypothetical protein
MSIDYRRNYRHDWISQAKLWQAKPCHNGFYENRGFMKIAAL